MMVKTKVFDLGQHAKDKAKFLDTLYQIAEEKIIQKGLPKNHTLIGEQRAIIAERAGLDSAKAERA